MYEINLYYFCIFLCQSEICLITLISFSHFMCFNFLIFLHSLFFSFFFSFLFFVFFLHCIWKTTFPSQAPKHHLFLMLCSSQPPAVSLLALLPLLCFLTLPVLDSLLPFFLSLMFLLVLSLHPSCQAEWGVPLGRCLQTAAILFGGLWCVTTPTQKSFTSLNMLLTAVIPPLHSGLYAVPLSKVRRMKVPHASI